MISSPDLSIDNQHIVSDSLEIDKKFLSTEEAIGPSSLCVASNGRMLSSVVIEYLELRIVIARPKLPPK